jgi:iron-sulfur cluster assembly accessory protein
MQTNSITITTNTGDHGIEQMREQGALNGGKAHLCYTGPGTVREESVRMDYSAVVRSEQQLPYLRVSTEIVSTEATGCGNVEGGGLVYKFDWTSETTADDYAVTLDNLTLIVDSKNMEHMQGASFDYKETAAGLDFVITNPSASDECVCPTPIFKLNS